VMFGLGPIFALVLAPRIVPSAARPRIKHGVIATNIALAVLVAPREDHRATAPRPSLTLGSPAPGGSRAGR
jgi:hypothetical protein